MDIVRTGGGGGGQPLSILFEDVLHSYGLIPQKILFCLIFFKSLLVFFQYNCSKTFLKHVHCPYLGGEGRGGGLEEKLIPKGLYI